MYTSVNAMCRCIYETFYVFGIVSVFVCPCICVFVRKCICANDLVVLVAGEVECISVHQQTDVYILYGHLKFLFVVF